MGFVHDGASSAVQEWPMSRPPRAGMLAALLASIAALVIMPRPGLADEQPDLKIEYLGLQAGGRKPTSLRFSVTNVGATESAPATATIQTLSPPPPGDA